MQPVVQLVVRRVASCICSFRYSVQAISLLIKEHTVHPTTRGADSCASRTCWLHSLWTWEVYGRTGRSFSSPRIGYQPTSVLERTLSHVPATEASCWRSASSICIAGLRWKDFFCLWDYKHWQPKSHVIVSWNKSVFEVEQQCAQSDSLDFSIIDTW